MNSYDFAKLEDGKMHPAPSKLVSGTALVYNPPAELYIANGYKPVKFTTHPEAPEGYYYIPGWEEQDNAIVQIWHLEELPPEEMSADEALNIILGGAT